jgi:hypothetical protein
MSRSPELMLTTYLSETEAIGKELIEIAVLIKNNIKYRLN